MKKISYLPITLFQSPSEISISTINWPRMFKLRNQYRYWKATKSRKQYNCVFCGSIILKSSYYQKFWKIGFPQLWAHEECFQVYKNEHLLLFRNFDTKVGTLDPNNVKCEICGSKIGIINPKVTLQEICCEICCRMTCERCFDPLEDRCEECVR